MNDASMALESAFSRPDRHSNFTSLRGHSMHPALTRTNALMSTEHGTRSPLATLYDVGVGDLRPDSPGKKSYKMHVSSMRDARSYGAHRIIIRQS